MSNATITFVEAFSIFIGIEYCNSNLPTNHIYLHGVLPQFGLIARSASSVHVALYAISGFCGVSTSLADLVVSSISSSSAFP